jgi:Glycosyltransferases involved in cell wall biogenesis
MRPLVSIYMLTYNHEKFIAEAIESVTAQQCDFPIELIIGEDCSTDSTGEIVRDYQRRYPALIRILTSERNVGMAANAARCIQAFRGDYVAICEGDDCWIDPTKLARQVSLMEAMPDVALACHAINRVDASNKRRIRIQRAARKSRLLSTRELILGDGDFIPTCSILAKRALFINIPAWRLQAPVGDYPLVLNAAQVGCVAYQDRVMSTYRINVPDSWTSTAKSRSSIDQRLAHALAIERMLDGYAKEIGEKHKSSVNAIARKYIFNAIVRCTDNKAKKMKALDDLSHKLSRLDYVLAWLSLTTGKRMSRVRSFPVLALRQFLSIANNLK